MADWKPFGEAEGGVVSHWMDDGEGGGIIRSVQDVAPVVEANRIARTHGDGYSADRSMLHVGSVPAAVMQLWKETEGWDPWNVADPDVRKKWFQKLMDPDWRAFRTSEASLDFKNGKMR